VSFKEFTTTEENSAGIVYYNYIYKDHFGYIEEINTVEKNENYFDPREEINTVNEDESYSDSREKINTVGEDENYAYTQPSVSARILIELKKDKENPVLSELTTLCEEYKDQLEKTYKNGLGNYLIKKLIDIKKQRKEERFQLLNDIKNNREPIEDPDDSNALKSLRNKINEISNIFDDFFDFIDKNYPSEPHKQTLQGYPHIQEMKFILAKAKKLKGNTQYTKNNNKIKEFIDDFNDLKSEMNKAVGRLLVTFTEKSEIIDKVNHITGKTKLPIITSPHTQCPKNVFFNSEPTQNKSEKPQKKPEPTQNKFSLKHNTPP
jgi:hypothetical protein